jgi:hypothetical protein
MWIRSNKFLELEKKIAILEKEQLSIKEYVKEAIKSDEELIKIVKEFSADIKTLESINANSTKLTS